MDEFSRFYREFQPKLVAYIMYLGANRQEATDCAQETLVEALSTWVDLDTPRAWCRKVARRKYCRQQASCTEESVDEVPPEGQPLFASTDRFDEFEQRYDILALVRRLPPRQREVMALTLAGETPAEIAEKLGVPSERVRSNLRWAKKRLNAALEASKQNKETRP